MKKLVIIELKNLLKFLFIAIIGILAMFWLGSVGGLLMIAVAVLPETTYVWKISLILWAASGWIYLLVGVVQSILERIAEYKEYGD